MADTFQSLEEAATAIMGTGALNGASRAILVDMLRKGDVDLARLNAMEIDARRVAQACSYVRGLLGSRGSG